jgi:hypothetical protein
MGMNLNIPDSVLEGLRIPEAEIAQRLRTELAEMNRTIFGEIVHVASEPRRFQILLSLAGCFFVPRAGEHGKAGILWKARIAGGQLAEIEKRATIRADDLDVGTCGAQAHRSVDIRLHSLEA